MKFPTVEIEKRDRDEHTDDLIKSLLDEEKASKKQKRTDTDVGDRQVTQARKGKTFAEIEAEEGGPIKESLVGMAQTKRALDRKRRDVDVGDTDVVTNTERFEKDTLDVEQEEGITFEPFNLKQEREEGYFDDEGNYVLRKQRGEDGEDEKDAWLTSEEAKVVSDAVRKKIEEQRAREEEAARRGPLTDRQIAQRKADMAAMMRPEETVTRALKRLGGGGATGGAGAAAATLNRAMGKRERARLLAQQQQQQGTDPTSATADPEARERFTRMTELADELLAEGELEIYSATQEELLRSARMWLPQLAQGAQPPAAAAAGSKAGGSGAKAPAADDDDEDMFADDKGDGAAATATAVRAVDEDQDMFADDDDDDEGKEEGKDTGAGGRREEAQGRPTSRGDGGGEAPGGDDGTRSAAGKGSGSASAAATSTAVGAAGKDGGGAAPPPPPAGVAGGGGAGGEVVDYNSWPIKELKRLLQERGVDPSGFVEKSDLAAKVREVVDAGPAEGTGGAATSGGSFVAPPGYVYDPSSGYFYSEDSGMYYDTSSGGYCQAATGKWFYLDPTNGAFVEWKQ